MTKPQFVAAIWTVLALVACSGAPKTESAESSPQLQGPYMGQPAPGDIPQVFAPDFISAVGNEGSLVFLPGGREAYFHNVEPSPDGGPPHVAIMVTKEVDGKWTAPEVAQFSRVHTNMYPSIHPDGSRLFFQSDRPIDPTESEFEYNIWYVDREKDSWSEPKSIGRPVNGRNNTGGASVTLDGTLYFTVMDMEGPQELYRSEFHNGSYGEPVRLPRQVNAAVQQFDSYVSPDESFLIFYAMAGRGGHGASGGLAVAFRDEHGTWGATKDLGSLFNSGDRTGTATISPDGRYVFFSQPDPESGTDMDVFWVDAGVVRRMNEGR